MAALLSLGNPIPPIADLTRPSRPRPKTRRTHPRCCPALFRAPRVCRPRPWSAGQDDCLVTRFDVLVWIEDGLEDGGRLGVRADGGQDRADIATLCANLVAAQAAGHFALEDFRAAPGIAGGGGLGEQLFALGLREVDGQRLEFAGLDRESVV